jgi:hypothetical protein
MEAVAQCFDKPLARPLARGGHWADQTQCGEWRRKQTGASLAGLLGFFFEGAKVNGHGDRAGRVRASAPLNCSRFALTLRALSRNVFIRILINFTERQP